MSRHDPYEPPWLRPLAKKQWAKYREQTLADWNKGREKIYDRAGPPDDRRKYGYLPEPLHFSTLGFKHFRDQPPLDWKDESVETEHGYDRLPVCRWQDGIYTVVVTRREESLEEYDYYGKFTDEADTAYYGETWGTMLFRDPILRKYLRQALRAQFGNYSALDGFEGAWEALKKELRNTVSASYPKENHKRTLKGSEYSHRWRVGCYDTFDGKDSHPERGRKYRYIQLEGYDYDELRAHYWSLGRSKREADELARQEFRARVKKMQEIAKGFACETWVEAKVYHINDEDEEDELAASSTSGEVDDDNCGQWYVDVMAREAAKEALSTARAQAKREELSLPGVA